MNIIIGFIIAFLIFYFVWQLIKRAIFVKIFKTLNDFSQNKDTYGERYDSKRKKNKEFKKDIKWDAETVDFEEVSESKE